MNDLYIAAFSASGPESFVIAQKGREARKTLDVYGSDLSLMALCLSFKHDKLVLRDPRALFYSSEHMSASMPLTSGANDESRELMNLEVQNTSEHKRSIRGGKKGESEMSSPAAAIKQTPQTNKGSNDKAKQLSEKRSFDK